MGEDDPRLVGRYKGENVTLCVFIHTFQDGEIGDYSSRVEVLESVKYKALARWSTSNSAIVISRIYSPFGELACRFHSRNSMYNTSDEIVVLNDQFLISLLLFIRTHNMCSN